MSETINSNVSREQIVLDQNIEHTQMMESNVDVPPEENSPKNIMNILNDDCLQAILLKIDKVQDFHSAAEVCTRFQENAKICFPFKKIWLGDSDPVYPPGNLENKSKISDCLINSPSLENFLTIFGSQIKSIDCNYPPAQNPKLVIIRYIDVDHVLVDKNLDLITKHCANTLDKLRVYIKGGHVWNLRSPFRVLRTLDLGCAIKHIDPALLFPEINSSFFTCYHRFAGSANLLANKFLKLENASLCGPEITNEQFVEFLDRNPQIRSLSLYCCSGFTSSICQEIGTRLTNLVNLCVVSVEKFFNDVVHLGQFWHLKSLSFSFYSEECSSSVKLILSCLIQNKQLIEEFNIYSETSIDIEIFKMLEEFKAIKKLRILRWRQPLSSYYVVDIVKHLPVLEYFRISMLNLKLGIKILQHCNKNLIKLDLPGIVELNSNLDDYNTLVKLATGRVKVTISISDYFQIDEDILSQIRKTENKWVRLLGSQKNRRTPMFHWF